LSSTPQLDIQSLGSGQLVRLSGNWGAASITQRAVWRQLKGPIRQASQLNSATWDLTEVQGFDHIAAQLLWTAWGQKKPDTLKTNDFQQAIIERVANLTVAPKVDAGEKKGLLCGFYRLGELVFGGLSHAKDMLQLVGQLLLDTLSLLRRPLRGPWHDFSGHLFRMGAQALPITALTMPRAEIIAKSLNGRGALIVTRSMQEACEISNRIAPEHLEVSSHEPHRWEPVLRHAGAIFLGAYTSESLGDYCAGPNHVLPTSGTARFSSPLSVMDFQKRSSIIEVSEQGAQKLGPIANILAQGEGLHAHGQAAVLRLK